MSNSYMIKRGPDLPPFVIQGDTFRQAFLDAQCVDWKKAQLFGLDLSNVQFTEGGFSKGGDASGLQLSDSRFYGCCFYDIKLKEAEFRKVVFDCCEFLNVDLSSAVIVDCEFRNCRFDKVSFDEAAFKRSLIYRGRMTELRMRGTRFYDTALPVDFSLETPAVIPDDHSTTMFAAWALRFCGRLPKSNLGELHTKALRIGTDIQWDRVGHALDNQTSGKKALEGSVLHRACPECGKPVRVKMSAKGHVFIGCTGWPACRYSRDAEQDDSDKGDDGMHPFCDDAFERG